MNDDSQKFQQFVNQLNYDMINLKINFFINNLFLLYR